MLVLGICASPHAQGNTAYALHTALSEIETAGIETTYISLHDKRLEPCDGCFVCRDTGRCVHVDDMQPLYDALPACDALILASPVYMGMMTGPMKIMMDRTVVYRTGGRFQLSGKVGGGIACGGFRNGGQELTLQCMHTFFLQQDMYVVSDGADFSHSGAAIAGQAAEDSIGLATVKNLSHRIVGAIKRLAPG